MPARTRKAPEPRWSPPETFDEYRLLRAIGRGRTGRVYLAHDTLLDRPVAVKFLLARDAAALSRFLVEARATARLQHPNVATLYRVGQLDDRAYLVSEFIQGTSLDKVERPVGSARLAEIALDLARGLSAAHARGVLHRDIKPGNAVVTASGDVKLVDFGLAKMARYSADTSTETATDDSGGVSGGGSGSGRDSSDVDGSDPVAPDVASDEARRLVGTPYFMAPEAWRGEELTARSDLFSLGLLLYELAAGKGPFRDIPIARLSEVVPELDARPIAQVAPALDERLAKIIDRCLRRNPEDRFGSAAELVDALELVLYSGETNEALPEGNPYRGLRAFEAEHRSVFFGRRRDVRALVERLRSESFVLVTGDSGVGKSSVCRAGVIPEVEEGALEDGRTWSGRVLVPGRAPLIAFAEALSDHTGLSQLQTEELLRHDPGELARRIRQTLGRERGLLIFVDQLEELVTIAPAEEAAAVSELLAQFAFGTAGLRVLGSARSDFLTRISGLPALGVQVPNALHLLRPMQPEEIREAIVGPARARNVRYESEQMVEALVQDTVLESGGLPLLQFALAELWESRDVEAGLITRAALEQIGGVGGALARHADGVLAQLLPQQRTAARSVLLRLVSADGTRSRRTDAELVGSDERFRAALDALVRARLLVATEGNDGTTAYDIAHEALLRGWGTLARWLVEEAERRQVRERVETAAAEWERVGRARDPLFGPVQLQEARGLDDEALTGRGRDFLAASEANVRRVRILRRSGVVAVLLLALCVYAGVRWKQETERRQEVDALLSQAQQALGLARTRADTASRVRREALVLFDGARKDDAEPVWDRATKLEGEAEKAYGDAGDRFEKAILLGEDRADVRSGFADFLLERALRADAAHQSQVRDLLLQRMRVYDQDGSRWKQWMSPADVTLASRPAGAKVRLFRFESKEGRRVAIEQRSGTTPDRTTLEPGSYVASFELEGHTPVRYPLQVTRGELLTVEVPLLPKSSVPEGFVHIPAGRFLFGTAQDESIREFFNTVPIHAVETDGFLIGRTEVTWAEWIQYLEALPAAERARRTPKVASQGLHGYLALLREGDGWRLELRPQNVTYRVREGEPLVYSGRKTHTTHDWMKLPVSGIHSEDAQAYLRWLDETGRVPGARLCTEHEWERAARGADEREFPHGDRLLVTDANFDQTYGKVPEAFGPDQVASHPASESPFGLHDMSGNVWEWVTSSLKRGEVLARGGSFYFASNSARITNRELPEPTLRDANVGLRVCATLR